MAYSIIYANGDGSNKTFSINFPLGFISRDDVTCRVGEEVDALGDPVYREITWITDGLVTISGDAPPVGTNNVVFYRTVDKEALVHEYTDGVAIEEANLDESNKQLIMALHEFLDGRYTSGLSINDLAEDAEAASAAAMLAAAEATEAAASITLPLPVASGGTGSTTAANARTALGVYSTAQTDSAIAAFGSDFNDFRLTLTSGIPVTTSDVTGAGTLYCTPVTGNKISLYSGTAWVTYTSVEFSLALSGLTSGLPYDVFCYANAGVATLELTAWTSGTSRATALTRQDGVLVKSGSTTRRYIGTIVPTAAGTTEDSAAKRFVWNYYHRTLKPLTIRDSTPSWTYFTAAYRQANLSSANQVDFVIGVAEEAVNIGVCAQVGNSTSTARNVFSGVGLDSTSTPTVVVRDATSGTAICNIVRSMNVYPGVGKHYLAWLEYGAGSDTQTWVGAGLYGLDGGIFV